MADADRIDLLRSTASQILGLASDLAVPGDGGPVLPRAHHRMLCKYLAHLLTAGEESGNRPADIRTGLGALWEALGETTESRGRLIELRQALLCQGEDQPYPIRLPDGLHHDSRVLGAILAALRTVAGEHAERETLAGPTPAARPGADTQTDTPKKTRKRTQTGPRNKKDLLDLVKAIERGRRSGSSAEESALEFVVNRYSRLTDPEKQSHKAAALLKQIRRHKMM